MRGRRADRPTETPGLARSNGHRENTAEEGVTREDRGSRQETATASPMPAPARAHAKAKSNSSKKARRPQGHRRSDGCR